MKVFRIKPGDKIGIVAPSASVTDKDVFDRGVSRLKNEGFDVMLAPHVFACGAGYSATPKEKVSDLHAMFSDASIRAIICAQGGQNANSCLSYLDWDLLRANPKIFLGVSDSSVLLNAIYQKTKMVCFHGDDLMYGFGGDFSDQTVAAFFQTFVRGDARGIEKNDKTRVVCRGKATGKALGGNIGSLLALAGTPYWPDLNGAILFLESFGFDPEACSRAMHQFYQLGVFDQIAGAVVGYIVGEDDGDHVYKTHEILFDVAKDKSFPILKVDAFGHKCPNVFLPFGATVRLDTDEGGVRFVEPFLNDDA